MYEQYWGLDRKPFEPGWDEIFYYPGESHQGTLLKLRYALESRHEAALLCGPSGSGKTLLVRNLLHQLPDWLTPRVHVVFPTMDRRELLAFLAHELTGTEDYADIRSVDHNLNRIHIALSTQADRGRHAVVVVDEAHTIVDHETLESMRMLLNLQHQERPVLSLVLAGQPTLLKPLTRNPSFDQRLCVKALLQPWDEEGTISYINHRLSAAGASRTIFSEGALEQVHSRAQGIARSINRLCDLVLLVGYAEGLEKIERDHVDSVFNELIALQTGPPSESAHSATVPL